MKSTLRTVLATLSLAALAQAQSPTPPTRKPGIEPEEVREVEQRLRDHRPPPFLLNKDGTPFRPGAPRPPENGTVGDWLTYINKSLGR